MANTKKNNGYKSSSKFNNKNYKDSSKSSAPGKVPAWKEEVRGKVTNNPDYWNRAKALFDTATRIQFTYPTGTPIDLHRATAQDMLWNNSTNSLVTVEKVHPYRVPGIMIARAIPSIGIATSASDPVNIASRLIYSCVRHANSGSRNYESVDLMMYYLAGQSLVAAHSELVRIYGLAMKFSNQNRYIGEYLIESLGWNSADVYKHLADLRMGINVLAARINAFAFPSNFALYKRAASLSADILADSRDVKGQLYAIQYDNLYKWSAYDVLDTQQAQSTLILTKCPWGLKANGTAYEFHEGCTVEQGLTFTQTLIEAMLVSEDIGLMSGDTLKAFNSSGILQIQDIDIAYSTDFTYDYDRLMQIHNTVTPMVYNPFGNLSNTGTDSFQLHTCCYRQQDGNIIFQPTMQVSTLDGDSNLSNAAMLQAILNPVIDIGSDNPDPDQIMIASRDILTFELDITNPNTFTGTFKITNCGTEIIGRFDIYGLVGPYPGTEGLTTVGRVASMVYGSSFDAAQVAKSNFDWAPLTLFAKVGAGIISPNIVGELFNTAPITDQNLRNLNLAALHSVFNIEALGMAAVAASK